MNKVILTAAAILCLAAATSAQSAKADPVPEALQTACDQEVAKRKADLDAWFKAGQKGAPPTFDRKNCVKLEKYGR